MTALALAVPLAFAGKYEVRIHLPSTGLTSQGDQAITFEIRGGAPKVAARIEMPSMPSMPVMEPAVTDGMMRVRFPHGGHYRLTLTLRSPGEPDSQFEFALSVDAHSHHPDLMSAAMGTGLETSGFFSSGTSQVPRASPHAMLSWKTRDWTILFHGVAFATHTNQTGPRGRDKFFAPNWTMTMASHTFGPGVLTLRSMLTLEPLTITGRRYPLLFQTGETANGIPIINGQHPHDFFMELAASYVLPLGARTSIHLYGGPRGDPALGPPAFPHRPSASENPLAVISHHHQDSTHISSDVVTAGITHGPVTWELSGFHGQEPDEKRWGMEQGAIDSLSTRLTVNPSPRWSGQFSIGRINNREVTHPLRDTLRTTASIGYERPLSRGHLSAFASWGRNHDLAFTQQPGLPRLPFDTKLRNARIPLHVVSVPTRIPGEIYNSYLAECTWRFRRDYLVWGRAENTDKDSTLLFEEAPFVLLVDERRFARVQLYTGGFGREFHAGAISRWLTAMLGAQLTVFHAPPQLAPAFGSNPVGVQAFLRIRAGRRE